MKNLTLLYAFILICLYSNKAQAQYLNIKNDSIIYTLRPQIFKQPKFSFNKTIINVDDVQKLLKNNARSADFYKIGVKNAKPAAALSLAGLALYSFAAYSNISTNQKLTLFGASIITSCIGKIFTFKSNKNMYNALQAFNKNYYNMVPNENNTDTFNLVSNPIKINSNYFGASKFYMNNAIVAKKEMHTKLENDKNANVFYTQMLKKEKLRNVSLITSAVTLVYPFVTDNNIYSNNPRDFQHPITTNISFIVSLTSFYTAAFAHFSFKKLRNNCIRAYNKEVLLPYNKKQERLINEISSVRIGAGNFGYGILVSL